MHKCFLDGFKPLEKMFFFINGSFTKVLVVQYDLREFSIASDRSQMPLGSTKRKDRRLVGNGDGSSLNQTVCTYTIIKKISAFLGFDFINE